jgi:hypothetical protein
VNKKKRKKIPIYPGCIKIQTEQILNPNTINLTESKRLRDWLNDAIKYLEAKQ